MEGMTGILPGKDLRTDCDQASGMSNRLEWWEANPNSLSLLKPDFLELIDATKKTAEAVGTSVRTLQRWKRESRRPSIKRLIKLAEILKIRRTALNDKIMGLASFNSKKEWHAKFPINEHPSHAGIIAHGFFDGNECCGILVYGTLTREENDDFARLVRESVPDAHLLEYSRDRKGLPASITQLLKNHYGVPTFLSDRCIFPDKLMALALKDQRYRREILRAAFLDEGHVTMKDGICAFGIKNGRLTAQVCRLLDAEGYEHWSAQTPSETQVYLRFGTCKKFYQDVLPDMPGAYRKKRRILELLAKLEKTRIRKKLRLDTMNSIMSMVRKSKKVALDDIYRAFGAEDSNKKIFYNRHMRKLKNLHMIETLIQGDMTWVLDPASGKPESNCFWPTKRRGECAGNGSRNAASD